MEFARTKLQLFERWCSSKKEDTEHAKLRHLLLVEEFKRCINSDVKTFLDDKEVESLVLAARLADDYSLTYKASIVNKPFSRKPFKPSILIYTSVKTISPQSKPCSLHSSHKSNLINPSHDSSHSFTPKSFFSGEVPYPSLFATIANNLAILYFNV